jgi:DNA-directed RNA polymerase specialized sigma24 family protein
MVVHDRDPKDVGPLARRTAPAAPASNCPNRWLETRTATGLSAVGSLPPMQRAAVIHRYVLDLPYAEIADALGISEEAARANTYEGRRKLRSMQGSPHE